MEPIDTHYYFISRKKVFVKDRMSKRKKMSFLFISLTWLSNELLWSINKLKQGLWCTIWLSYIYTLGATLYFGVWWIRGGASYIYTLAATLYFGVWWIRGDASFFLGELLQMSFSFFSPFFSVNCVSFIQSFYVSTKTSSTCITCFVNVCKGDYYPH